jgi:NADPH:quinone reductase-like Zn-dependent oxidoreductase
MGLDDSGLGSFAEYMCIAVDKGIVRIPDHIAFEKAAASCEGSHYALNFINKVDLKTGYKVMVYGATGAIGSAAVQLLKAEGIYVTAVGNTKNTDMLRSLGSDKVVDYQTEDFRNDKDRYDAIFDAVGKSTFALCKPLLNEKGVYLSSELAPWNQKPIHALTTANSKGKKDKFPIPRDIKTSLKHVQKLLADGKFKPVIDREYKIEQIKDAFTYVNSGQKTGNVILRIAAS